MATKKVFSYSRSPKEQVGEVVPEQPCSDSPIGLDARAALSTYVVMGLLFGIPLIPSAFLAHGIGPKLISVSGMTLVFLWVQRFRLSIENGVLTYTSLFGGTRVTQLQQIESAWTEFGGEGHPFGPFMRLIVKTRSPAKPDSLITINIKVFSREDLRRAFAILREKMSRPPRMSIFGPE